MMATFWVCNIYILLLVTCLGNAQFLDYFDDSIPCPPYPLTFGSNAGFIVPNATDPCVAPLPQSNPAVPSAGNKAAPEPGAPPAAANPPDNADTPLPRDGPPPAVPTDTAGAAPVQPLPAAPGVGPVTDDAPNLDENQEKPAPLVKRQAPADLGDDSLPVLPDVNPFDPSSVLPAGLGLWLIDPSVPPLPEVNPLNPSLPTGGVSPDPFIPSLPEVNPNYPSLPTGGIPPIPIEDPLSGRVPPTDPPIPPLPTGGIPPIPIADPLTGGVSLVPGIPDVNMPIGGVPLVPGNDQPDAEAPTVPDVSPPDVEVPSIPGLPIDPDTIILPAAPPIIDDAIPHAPTTPGGLLCNLSTLIQTLVNAILELILSHLKQLIHLIVQRLENVIRTLLGKLLPDVSNTLMQLLHTLLPTNMIDVQVLDQYRIK
ncbi:formin-2-like [Planococcus citri]|uniref:formin-2-like n=1 Tax=Planococcus citri TaxID=170843 RepID=UPI0031FA03E9